MQEIAMCLNAGGMKRQDAESETLIAHTLTAGGFDASEGGTGRGVPLSPPIGFMWQSGFGGSFDSDHVGTIVKNQTPAVAFTERGRTQGRTFESQEEVAYCLTNPGSGGRTHSRQLMTPQMAVRRLTPVECERLQGFPDNYTAVQIKGKPAADGPRYRALGNSMAVPVIRWIGLRIIEAVAKEKP